MANIATKIIKGYFDECITGRTFNSNEVGIYTRNSEIQSYGYDYDGVHIYYKKRVEFNDDDYDVFTDVVVKLDGTVVYEVVKNKVVTRNLAIDDQLSVLVSQLKEIIKTEEERTIVVAHKPSGSPNYTFHNNAGNSIDPKMALYLNDRIKEGQQLCDIFLAYIDKGNITVTHLSDNRWEYKWVPDKPKKYYLAILAENGDVLNTYNLDDCVYAKPGDYTVNDLISKIDSTHGIRIKYFYTKVYYYIETEPELNNIAHDKVYARVYATRS